MRLTALVLLCLLPQDPGEKVRTLVEKLGSEVIAEREEASSELVKLGTAALAAIRDQLARAGGERKSRLQAVVKKIERDERVAKALAPAPAVTLKVSEAPVTEVLAEITRQSGMKVYGKRLDGSHKVTLELKGTPAWVAVEELCRAHGKLAWAPDNFHPEGSALCVAPGEYRPALKSEGRGLTLVLTSASARYLTWLSLDWQVFHPPTGGLSAARIEITELRDDQGTDLKKRADLLYRLPERDWNWKPFQPRTASSLSWWSENPADGKAARLAVLKGRLVAHLPLERKTFVSVKCPVAPGQSVERPEFILENVELKQDEEGRLRIEFDLFWKEIEPADPSKGICGPLVAAIRDRSGKLIEGRSSPGPCGLGYAATFPGLKPADVASLELLAPSEAEEIAIPFEFRDVPLR